MENKNTANAPLLQANIVYSTYSNKVVVMSSKEEMVLLFGQDPPQYDGTILTTRIYLHKDLAEKIVQLITDSIMMDKKKEETISYG